MDATQRHRAMRRVYQWLPILWIAFPAVYLWIDTPRDEHVEFWLGAACWAAFILGVGYLLDPARKPLPRFARRWHPKSQRGRRLCNAAVSILTVVLVIAALVAFYHIMGSPDPPEIHQAY